jgi:alpha-L-arabinofuranosidase
MHNFFWEGMESNQVGVIEIVEMCRAAGAELLMSVSLAGDGRPEYVNPSVGESRAGDAAEAADLLSYSNDPDDPTRRLHNADHLLSEWLSGLHSACRYNLSERNSMNVEVATQADFFGNRWTVNALMIGSRDKSSLYLHVVNTDLDSSVDAEIDVAGSPIMRAVVHCIAPDSLDAYVDFRQPDVFDPVQSDVEILGGTVQ